MQANLIETRQALLLAVQAPLKVIIAVNQYRWLTQFQQGGQHPGDLIAAHPRRVLDQRLVVGHSLGDPCKAFQASTIGDVGGEQGCR
ncbi:hypothetical protein D9M71_469020 [compost metagenome]